MFNQLCTRIFSIRIIPLPRQFQFPNSYAPVLFLELFIGLDLKICYIIYISHKELVHDIISLH